MGVVRDGLVLLGISFQDCRTMIFTFIHCKFQDSLSILLLVLSEECLQIMLDNSCVLGYILYPYMCNRAALCLSLVLKKIHKPFSGYV